MITKKDITFAERHLGCEGNIQSYNLTAVLILDESTTIERLQGKPPTPSDFGPLARRIIFNIYGDLLETLAEGITLLHSDPTQARQVLTQLHNTIQNEINS